MNNDRKQLLPDLRFPEFVNSWKKMELGQLCDYWNGLSHENGVNNFGKYFLISLNSIDIDGNLKSDMKRVSYTDNSLNRNDLVMVLSDVAHGNFLGLTDIIPSNNYVLNQRMAGLRIKSLDKTDSYFLRSYINKNQNYFKKNGQGSSQLNLSKGSVTKFPILLPQDLLEQQKIASCLSSLDELITAQKEKLELLKNHKKGLMQNLFPQEGETVPNFRFPEFENDGEWEKKRLNEIGVLVNGLTYSPQDIREKGLLVLRSSNVQNGQIELNDCVYVTPSVKGVNLTQKEDILICIRNGSKSLIGKNAIIKNEMPFTTHGAFMTIFRASNPSFVFQLFQSEAYQNQVDADLGATINSINGKNFLKYEFFIPKLNEQEKIASCLGSLDNLIWSQTEKIERLQLHKKGLMQGLFPKIID